MSDHVPIPDPWQGTPQTGAAGAPAGPVPGRPDPHPEPTVPAATGPVPGRPDRQPPPPPAAADPTPPPSSLTEPTDPDSDPPDAAEGLQELPRLQSPRRGRRLVPPPATPTPPLTPQQRLLLLDTWQRSGLPAADFAALVGLSKHTLYSWKKKFDSQGPAGLLDQPRGGPTGSKLPELTRRTILMLKQANPEYGCQKISDLLLRGPALPASPAAVAATGTPDSPAAPAAGHLAT